MVASSKFFFQLNDGEQLYDKSCSGYSLWIASANFLANSINVIEIGARYGESSKLILQNSNVNNYIIIDPYTSYEEYIHDGFNNTISNDNDDVIFNQTKKKKLQ